MTQDTETQILVELRNLNERVDQAITDNEKFSNRFNDYQQATQWVVQLSFGLIASATIITIIGTVFKR
jgi:hypothetical protein